MAAVPMPAGSWRSTWSGDPPQTAPSREGAPSRLRPALRGPRSHHEVKARRLSRAVSLLAPWWCSAQFVLRRCRSRGRGRPLPAPTNPRSRASSWACSAAAVPPRAGSPGRGNICASPAAADERMCLSGARGPVPGVRGVQVTSFRRATIVPDDRPDYAEYARSGTGSFSRPRSRSV
jgi:hypothetical protein